MDKYVFPELKKRLFSRHCQIIATGSFFPDRCMNNEQIIYDNNLSVKDIAIQKTLGVNERRVTERGLADSDLLVKAAQQCLQRAGISPNQLSRIIVTKFVGDRALPMTASMLQRKLDCSHAVQSYDIDGGINSFLQALDIASSAINSGDDYVLISSGGIINNLVRKSDPRHAFLFGDGAAAVLLGPSDSAHIESSYFYSNCQYVNLSTGYSYKKLFTQKNDPVQDSASLYDLYDRGNWKEAKDFILEGCAVTIDKMLTDSGLKPEDIDLFLITENNSRLWSSIVEKLNISHTKTISVIGRYGNTMSAMLPVLLNEAVENNRIPPHGRIALLSIGEGISGGGLIYKF